ncbi:uncharacterized protein [Drosophila bipectinata]|uniref:uncharacterized protein isoform X2 n=1 Tax=Drosophila bipectinata TaxID=42026 RepID=UPI001C8AB53A|nr:uncharacterized protein LOC108118660 isoform X2 [Drosophila bipectinata]
MNMTAKEYLQYQLIKRELENEELLTFEDLLELTQISPRNLARALDKVAREFRFYKKKKGAVNVVAAGLSEVSGNTEASGFSGLMGPSKYSGLARLPGPSGHSGNSGPSVSSGPPKYQRLKAPKKRLELEFEKAAASQVKTKAKDGSSALCLSFSIMSLDQNDDDEMDDEEHEDHMSFEYMVILTRTHPLMLERSIRHMARHGRFLKDKE